jgi:hypothetical protein
MEEDPVRRLVKETVSETLLQLGFDMKDPKALQADMAHLRFWRETTTSLTEKSIFGAIGFIIVTSLGVLWLGFQALLGRA